MPERSSGSNWPSTIASRASEQSKAAQGGPDERTAAVALAAANEQLAAREAWVKYIEHRY